MSRPRTRSAVAGNSSPLRSGVPASVRRAPGPPPPQCQLHLCHPYRHSRHQPHYHHRYLPLIPCQPRLPPAALLVCCSVLHAPNTVQCATRTSSQTVSANTSTAKHVDRTCLIPPQLCSGMSGVGLQIVSVGFTYRRLHNTLTATSQECHHHVYV